MTAITAYSALTVPALRNECKGRGLQGYSRLTKIELIQLLQNDDKPVRSETPARRFSALTSLALFNSTAMTDNAFAIAEYARTTSFASAHGHIAVS